VSQSQEHAPGSSEGARAFRPAPGWCAREVEEELPGLRLLTCELDVARPGSLTGSSPPDVRARLRELSNRMRGAGAVTMRRLPVPAAYRVFFRHIGLDPDVERTPIEAAVLERMLRGGFLSGGLLELAHYRLLLTARGPDSTTPRSGKRRGAAPQRLFHVELGHAGDLHRKQREPTRARTGGVPVRELGEQHRQRRGGVGDDEPARGK